MPINVFAQAPNITYTNPPVYTLGTPIAPLIATNTGGPVPANHYGQTTIFAGNSSYGNTDGIGTLASFSNPRGLTMDATGNIYVADWSNNLIRKITPAGKVTTLTGFGYTDAGGNSVNLTTPSGTALDAAGNIYVAAEGDNQIKKITPSNIVTTLAGNGAIGSDDGVGSLAYFRQPLDVAVDAAGNVYVADIGNSAVRKITPGGLVTTFAGGSTGYVDDIGTAAKFSGPMSVITDAAGNIYAADIFNHVIRKITPAGKVTTFAGIGEQQGEEDGPVATATLTYPYRLAMDIAGNIYVTENNGGNRVRKITPGGVVSTVAHSSNAIGADGKSIDIGDIYASGLVVNNGGFLFISDVGVNNIYKIAITGYGIDKPLPAGLSFDAATGIISGTPTAASAAQDYTITAYNLIGSSSFKITIKVVNSVLPPALPPAPFITYATPNTYQLNTPIALLKPLNTGGAVPATIYGAVTTFAGSGSAGSTDGTGTDASFNSPTRAVQDASGNLYVADRDNDLIRKVTPGGLVSTFAGGFNQPNGVAVDNAGNIYVADAASNQIKKITPGGVVSVFAGSGASGSQDGPAAAASFSAPFSVVADANGNIYVSDSQNNKIRKITPAGDVSTFAGNGSAGFADNNIGTNASFRNPSGINIDAAGNIYVADIYNYSVRKITPAGKVSTVAGNGTPGNANGSTALATFNGPTGVAIDAIGNIYVSDISNNQIRKIDLNNIVTTLAGSLSQGSNDGPPATAHFFHPNDVQVNSAGFLYVTDYGNSKIRKVVITGYTIDKPLPPGLSFDGKTGQITGTPTATSPATDYLVTAYNTGGSSTFTVNIKVINNVIPPVLPNPPVITYSTPNIYTVNVNITPLKPTNTGGPVPANAYGLVSTLAGTGGPGNANGPGATASFNLPNSVVTDAAGNIYVADSQNNQIRKITPGGQVSVFAGSGAQGNTDGLGTAATFNVPVYLAIDAGGNLYVSDALNSRIRKISPGGNVVTIATGINLPTGLAVDENGNVFVAENANNTIVKIAPDGTKTQYAGISGSSGAGNGAVGIATFNHPTGLAFGADGNLYIADASNSVIRKINTVTGIVSTFATGFSTPNGLAFDALGNLYVSDASANKIYKVTPAGNTVVFAGSVAGSVNGTTTDASFRYPVGMAIDLAGHLYVADYNNNIIRKINLNGYIIDKPLPAGLTFDATTGIISGTPTVQSPLTDYKVTAYNLGGSGSFTFKIQVLAIPVVTNSDVTGVINTCEGTVANTYQQFKVNGNFLSSDITVAAPSGFEVSTTAVGGYGNTVILPQTGGKVTDVMVYVRMTAAGVGMHTGDVVLSSAGVIDIKVPVKGTVNANKITSVDIVLNINPSCEGSTVRFTAVNPVNAGTAPVYLWKVNGVTIGNQRNQVYETSAVFNGDVVTCTLMNTTDCTGIPVESNPIIVTRTATVGATVSVMPTSRYPACPGDAVTFTATPVSAGNIYQWQVNGQNAGTNNPDFEGVDLKEGDIITCTITTASVCALPSASAPLVFAVSPLPTVAFAGNVVVDAHAGATLKPIISGDIVSYSWSPANGLSSTDVERPVARPLVTTVYTLQVVTATGCTATASVTATVVHDIGIPNTFTPNGDGYNDTWVISELENYPGCTVKIFNRNGTELFSSVGYSRPWNGTYNNKPVPYGTYYYVIDPKNGFKKLAGWVTVIR